MAQQPERKTVYSGSRLWGLPVLAVLILLGVYWATENTRQQYALSTPDATAHVYATAVTVATEEAALPTPTPPTGWKTYTSLSDAFTLNYPSDWAVDDEMAWGVDFEAPDNGGFFITVMTTTCNLNASLDQIVACLATEEAISWHQVHPDHTFRLVSKDNFDEGSTSGYLIEANTTDKDNYTNYHAWIYVPAPQYPGMVILAHYYQGGVTDTTSQRWRQVMQVVGSFRFRTP